MSASKCLFKITTFCIMSLVAASTLAQGSTEKTILFICEHGLAKSIVAAAYFSRLAEQEGLKIKVISRGTNPDEVVPEKINKLLDTDGFQNQNAKPVQLSSSDLKNADYVVTFNPIPDVYGKIENQEAWDIPSLDAAYPAARDSLLVNIRRIIQRIKTDNKKN